MMDQNKRVQEAAVSAFVNLEEEVGAHLSEHIPDILRTISASMNYYQSKNLLILLDSVACLFESLGSEIMSKPDVTNALLPPILSAFKHVDLKSEKQLAVSLFECLTAIATTCGAAVGEDALSQIVSRCGFIIESNTIAYRQIIEGMEDRDKPDLDILACSLDLLCGVVDGLGDASVNIVSKINFTPLLLQLIAQFEFDSNLPRVRNYYTNTVRQCAFALLGDVVRTCNILVSDENLYPVIPTVVAYVTIGPVLVSNNSSWALGELSMRRSQQFIDPFVDRISKALLFNLKRFEPGSRPIVRQNAAIALGRLCLVASRRLVENGAFAEMFGSFCSIMKKLRTDGEKLTAVKGFTLCIEASPQTGMTPENLTLLFELIASMFPPPSTLASNLREIVLAYRGLLGDTAWGSLWSSFPLEIQYRLNHSYALGLQLEAAT
jgi:transportin-1